MNIATDTTIDTRRWVCVRWDLFGGYYYVGPFAEAHEAADWATENEGTDISWQTEHLDPNIALEVCAPGKLPELEPDPDEPDRWTERQSDVGDFYLLMIGSDPLHLVGPFPDHRHAYSWAVTYQARTHDDGWQVLWLHGPAAPARLLTPAGSGGGGEERCEVAACASQPIPSSTANLRMTSSMVVSSAWPMR